MTEAATFCSKKLNLKLSIGTCLALELFGEPVLAAEAPFGFLLCLYDALQHSDVGYADGSLKEALFGGLVTMEENADAAQATVNLQCSYVQRVLEVNSASDSAAVTWIHTIAHHITLLASLGLA